MRIRHMLGLFVVALAVLASSGCFCHRFCHRPCFRPACCSDCCETGCYKPAEPSSTSGNPAP